MALAFDPIRTFFRGIKKKKKIYNCLYFVFNCHNHILFIFSHFPPVLLRTLLTFFLPLQIINKSLFFAL